MTTIVFNNDEDRKNFQLHMAITALQMEVKTGIIISRIPIMNVLRRFYPDLPRTKRAALKWLETNGPKKN